MKWPMKTQTNQRTWKINRPGLSAARMARALAAAVVGLTPLIGLHAQINGTISGSTASGVFGDDTVTSTTIGMSYFTYCPWIVTGIAGQNFGGYNFVFAGQGVASSIPNIASSDFTISKYAPWVGNNNSTANGNGIVAPDGTNYNRNVSNQEDGGANIIVTYTPTAATDPTNINFVQAYTLSGNGNGGPYSSTRIDTTVNNPFYNAAGVSGVGMNMLAGTTPFQTSSSRPGWLLDIPYTPEWGYGTNLADDTITNESDYFQTFISSQVSIGGTNYNVLYGGVQWGYTFSTIDAVPEPATLALAAAAFAGLACWARRQRTRTTD